MISLLGTILPEGFTLRKGLLSAQKQTMVVTLNPEMLLYARKDPRYQRIINDADIRIIDGVGIVMMARLLYGFTLFRSTGVDTAQSLIAQARTKGKRVFLLGGTNDANEKACQTLGVKGLGGDFSQQKAIDFILSYKPDLLLVCLGVPRQEFFIHRLFTSYPQGTAHMLAMGVGGAVDFWAHPALRAPRFMRRIGFEWLWRVLLEPWRIPRIVRAVIIFPLACLYEKLLVK